MAERIVIRIMPDGRVIAETVGVKGPKCDNYMESVAEMVDGKIEKSNRKKEYYEIDQKTELKQDVQQVNLEDK